MWLCCLFGFWWDSNFGFVWLSFVFGEFWCLNLSSTYLDLGIGILVFLTLLLGFGDLYGFWAVSGWEWLVLTGIVLSRFTFGCLFVFSGFTVWFRTLLFRV